MWGEDLVSDSQLVAECERVEAQYLEEQQWGPLSDGDLLAYVMEIENQEERKRITDIENENEMVYL